MLTKEQLDQLKAASPTTSNGNLKANSVGADEFFNQVMAKNTPKPQPSMMQRVGDTAKNVFNALTQSEKNLGEDIGRGLLGGDKYFKKIQDQYTSNVDELTKLAAKQTDPTQKQKYLDMAKSNFDDGQKVGVDFKGRSWEQIAGDVLGVALDVETTLTGLGAAKALKTANATSKLSTGEKILNTTIGGMKTGAKYGAAYGAAGGLEEGKDLGGVVEGTVKGVLTGATVGGVLSGGIAAAPSIVKGIKELPSNIMRGVELKTKSIEEIAKIPAKDVGKLNIREQAKWSSLQKANITNTEKQLSKNLQETSKNRLGGIENTAKTSTAKLSKQFDDDIANLKNISEKTEAKLSQSSIDTVIKERPAMRDLITNESKKYERIYEYDVKPVKNIILNKDDVFAKIDSKLDGTIDITELDVAQRIKNIIKFDKNGNIKLGDLNKQIKTLKTNISKKGASQSQVNVNNALSGIGELMEEKGADFSKSNTFWKQWKPVKDNIMTKFEPYNFSSTNTSKGAKFIEDIAKGKIDEKYLMDEITTRLGRDITPQEKSLVKNLDLYANSAKAKKIKYDLEVGKIEADRMMQETIEKAKTEVAAGKITNKALERIRKIETIKWDNRIKAIVRKFVSAAAAYAGVKGFEKVTGIDVPVL